MKIDIEVLKASGVQVDRYEHHPERRGHISEPVPIDVWLKRGERSFGCTVYQKRDDPRKNDYLHLVAQRYNMNVAEYHDITTHILDHRGKFDQLSLQYRKRTTESCMAFRRKLEAFIQ